MESLPVEILQQTLLPLSYPDTIRYCSTSTLAASICEDELFWIAKARLLLNVSPNEFRSTQLSPRERYLQLTLQRGDVFPGAERFMSYNEFARRAIRKQDRTSLEYIINKGFVNWSLAVEEAARVGDWRLTDLFLILSLDYTIAALGAIKGNQQELYDDILKRTRQRPDPEKILLAAAKGGNRTVFDLVRNQVPNIDWDFVALAAIRGRNSEMLDYIFQLAPTWNWNFNYLANAALETGNKELFEIFRELAGPNYNWRWDNMILSAANGGNLEMLDYIRKLQPANFVVQNPVIYNNSLLENAYSGGNRAVINYVNELVGNVKYITPNQLATFAIIGGNKEIFDDLMQSAGSNYNWDWNHLLGTAVTHGHKGIFDYLLRLVPSNYQLDWRLFYNMSRMFGQRAIMEYIRTIMPPDVRTSLNLNTPPTPPLLRGGISLPQ